MTYRPADRPPHSSDSKRLAAVFLTLVIQPIRLAHKAFGPRLWPPLEVAAKALGCAAGVATRPVFARYERDHVLAPLLRFTDLVEGSLGIVGTNEYPSDSLATRRVSHCPFASSLRQTTPFCTSLGQAAGKAACAWLVPGSRFEVVRTLSQGHSCCEYRYYR